MNFQVRLQSLWSLKKETRKTLRERLTCRAAERRMLGARSAPHFSAHVSSHSRHRSSPIVLPSVGVGD